MKSTASDRAAMCLFPHGTRQPGSSCTPLVANHAKVLCLVQGSWQSHGSGVNPFGVAATCACQLPPWAVGEGSSNICGLLCKGHSFTRSHPCIWACHCFRAAFPGGLKGSRQKSGPPFCWALFRGSHQYLRDVRTAGLFLGVPASIDFALLSGASTWDRRNAALSCHFPFKTTKKRHLTKKKKETAKRKIKIHLWGDTRQRQNWFDLEVSSLGRSNLDSLTSFGCGPSPSSNLLPPSPSKQASLVASTLVRGNHKGF